MYTLLVFSVYATDTNRHTDSKKSRRRPTKKFQAPYLAKRGLELFGRTIFAEHQVSRSLVRDSGRKQKELLKKGIVRPHHPMRPFRQVGRMG